MDYSVFINSGELNAYYRKDDCSSYQLYPIPEDLDNYYCVPIENISDVEGKRYDPLSGELVEIKITDEKVRKQRLLAYKEESDPLFMEWQYDQTPESRVAWEAKVEEIKTRIPFVK